MNVKKFNFDLVQNNEFNDCRADDKLLLNHSLTYYIFIILKTISSIILLCIVIYSFVGSF